MNIWEYDKLLIFIAFVIPGFISLKAYELFFPSHKADSSKQVIEAITYSCINYALLFWPIVYFVKNTSIETNGFIFFVFYIFVLFLAPILWVLIWKAIRTTDRFQDAAPHPTEKPWDYFFSKREPCWVVVTLKDGSKVGGNYDSKSFSSSAPAEEQLYLEESWLINDDGGLERPREETKGIIILFSEMVHIELFNKQ